MTFDREHLTRLTEGLIEDRLDDEEIRTLESILRDDADAKEFYADYLFNHAALALHAHGENAGPEELRLLFGLDSPDDPTKSRISRDFPAPRYRVRDVRLRGAALLAGAAIFAGVLVAGLLFLSNPSRTAPSFATISRTTNCLWGDSSTQTRVGSRLSRCVLNLREGVARIRFDCGVVVSLEGPSVLEIRSEKYTVLRSGRLVASVETSTGKGFVVDTPLGSITDWGTRFGVHVPPEGPGSVHVLDGEVEVLAKGGRRPVFMKSGDFLEMDDYRTKFNGGPAETTAPNGPPPKIIQVSSAQGRGAESWVVRHLGTIRTSRVLFPGHVAQPYMLVKTSFEPESDRKAVFRIDLAGAVDPAAKPFESVLLAFSYGPTELGYASNVPVSEFVVYGLADDSMDFWDENSRDWDALPGHGEEAASLGAPWVPLGRFAIEQGSRSGTITIKGDALDEFVRKDGNGLLTFAVARRTSARVESGLVHGFANRYHPTLVPPRLVFQWKD